MAFSCISALVSLLSQLLSWICMLVTNIATCSAVCFVFSKDKLRKVSTKQKLKSATASAYQNLSGRQIPHIRFLQDYSCMRANQLRLQRKLEDAEDDLRLLQKKNSDLESKLTAQVQEAAVEERKEFQLSNTDLLHRLAEMSGELENAKQYEHSNTNLQRRMTEMQKELEEARESKQIIQQQLASVEDELKTAKLLQSGNGKLVMSDASHYPKSVCKRDQRVINCSTWTLDGCKDDKQWSPPAMPSCPTGSSSDLHSASGWRAPFLKDSCVYERFFEAPEGIRNDPSFDPRFRRRRSWIRTEESLASRPYNFAIIDGSFTSQNECHASLKKFCRLTIESPDSTIQLQHKFCQFLMTVMGRRFEQDLQFFFNPNKAVCQMEDTRIYLRILYFPSDSIEIFEDMCTSGFIISADEAYTQRQKAFSNLRQVRTRTCLKYLRDKNKHAFGYS